MNDGLPKCSLSSYVLEVEPKKISSWAYLRPRFRMLQDMKDELELLIGRSVIHLCVHRFCQRNVALLCDADLL